MKQRIDGRVGRQRRSDLNEEARKEHCFLTRLKLEEVFPNGTGFFFLHLSWLLNVKTNMSKHLKHHDCSSLTRCEDISKASDLTDRKQSDQMFSPENLLH